MDFELGREEEVLRRAVSDFCERRVKGVALELDERGEFPRELVKEMSGLGFLGIMAPKEYGGWGMGHLPWIIAIEEFGKVFPSLGFFLEMVQLGIYLLRNSGKKELEEKIIPQLLKSERIACFAATEPGGGSDPSSTRTTARVEGDEFVINGRKTFITLAPIADMAFVLAKTDDKFNIILVEREAFKSTRRENIKGLHAMPVGEILFEDARVPRSNLIGEEGRGLVLALNAIATATRLSVASLGLGVAEGCFEHALNFAKERKLYGKPITELQAIQFSLAEMNTEIEASRWLCYKAAWLLDRGKNPREAGPDIARAKLFAVDTVNRVAPKAIQIMGGYGNITEYGVIKLLLDAVTLFSAGGTQEIMKLIIGRSIV